MTTSRKTKLKSFATTLKERAKTDSTILKFLGEQIFGKAPQPLTNDEGEPIAVAGFIFLKNENNNAGNPAND